MIMPKTTLFFYDWKKQLYLREYEWSESLYYIIKNQIKYYRKNIRVVIVFAPKQKTFKYFFFCE